MNHSVGPRFAFIGTFMWFASYVVWMVSTAAKIWVPLSTFLFGADKTQTWALGSLTRRRRSVFWRPAGWSW